MEIKPEESNSPDLVFRPKFQLSFSKIIKEEALEDSNMDSDFTPFERKSNLVARESVISKSDAPRPPLNAIKTKSNNPPESIAIQKKGQPLVPKLNLALQPAGTLSTEVPLSSAEIELKFDSAKPDIISVAVNPITDSFPVPTLQSEAVKYK